jgi:CRP/FNR family transcriptional regulator, cyclic AMP receptor protein
VSAVSLIESRDGDASTKSVPLTRLDAAFRAAVPDADQRLADRATAECRHLRPGAWSPEELRGSAARAFALLLVEGLVCQEILLAGRPSAQLLGPGDLFRPWGAIVTPLPCRTRWTCMRSATIAVLDDRFIAAARRWPDLIGVLSNRLNDQLANAARRTALVGLPRVEDRLLAHFWELADRWGIVRPEGVVVPLELTHEVIGRLVAARRPTVSLALSALAADGLLMRDATGRWTLSHRSLQAFKRDPAHRAPRAPIFLAEARRATQ